MSSARRNRWHPENWTRKTFLFTALFLVALNLFGPHGIVHWMRLHQEAVRLSIEEKVLNEEIQKIQREMSAFQNSKVVQERAIREKLGYLKSDEISIELGERQTE